MNIIVCIKQVPDPEAVVEQFSVNGEAKDLVPAPGVVRMISPFDENAIEAALQLKEAHGGKVCALCVGGNAAMEALKRAVQMGSDEAVLVKDPGFSKPNCRTTAYLLSKAIGRIGTYDLVLCGRQGADWDQGQTGFYLADNLGLPILSVATKIEKEDRSLRVERLAEYGYDVMRVNLPALLTVSNEINQPRLTPVAAILRAAKIKIPVWSMEDIGADAAVMEGFNAYSQLERIYFPEMTGECTLIEGEDEAELAANLIKALRADKVVSDIVS